MEHCSCTSAAGRRWGVYVVLLALVVQSCVLLTRYTAEPDYEMLGRLDSLLVAPEHLCTPYDAGAYPYPSSLENEIILRFGGIYDPYTNQWFASRDSVDIEHILARQEAHASGLCAQPDSVKAQFAADSLNLVLVHSWVNHGKGARDAAEWQPEHNQCWFAGRIVDVKTKYGLSVDSDEREALEQRLLNCSLLDMEVPPSPYPDFLKSDSLLCGPYADCKALELDHPEGVSHLHCAYRPLLDGDNNGWACGR